MDNMNYKEKHKEPKYYTNHKRTQAWKMQFHCYFPMVYLFCVGFHPEYVLTNKKEVCDWRHYSAILSEEDCNSFLSDKIEISFEEAEHIIKKKLMMKELIK